MGENCESDIFSSFDRDQVSAVRSLMIKVLLNTDMSKHFAKKNLIKGMLLTNQAKDDPIDLVSDEVSRHEILSFILHMADISNPAKKRETSIKWTDRVLEEFFEQGDEEKKLGLDVSALCDRNTVGRAESQIGFINFIVLPSYELLGELVPRIRTEVIPMLEANLEYWIQQKALEPNG